MPIIWIDKDVQDVLIRRSEGGEGWNDTLRRILKLPPAEPGATEDWDEPESALLVARIRCGGIRLPPSDPNEAARYRLCVEISQLCRAGVPLGSVRLQECLSELAEVTPERL